MKFLKMIYTALAILFYCVNFFNIELNALFGNTHYNLGKKIIEKLDEKLSEDEEDAFLSGMVYADIGRFKFDKETKIDSDSCNFVEKMKKFVKTTEERWFTLGMEMHIIQDAETSKFLRETLEHECTSYYEYIVACCTLDSYFSKKSGILYNEFLDKFNFNQVISEFDIKNLNKIIGFSEDKIKSLEVFEIYVKSILEKYSDYHQKNNLLIYDDLIQKTYKSLGFEISQDEIHEQAGNILGAFIITLAVFDNKVAISEDLASKIEEKSDILTDLCISKCKLDMKKSLDSITKESKKTLF